MTKCCSTCCNRISRKLAALTGGSATTATDANVSTPVAPEKVASPGRPDEAAANPTPAPTREKSSSTSSCDDDAIPAEKPPSRSELLLPPRPVEPRPAVKLLQPGADNSETDSADEIGANHIAANPEAQLNVLQPPPIRSNGNIGQVIPYNRPNETVLTKSNAYFSERRASQFEI